MRKKTIVIHSGGMDSSICLRLALQDFPVRDVLSLSFAYRQRHLPELVQAKKICHTWGVDHVVISLECLQEITENALMDPSVPISQLKGSPPNTLVVGRNGLMARLGAIHAQHLGASSIYMGIMGADGAHSGYRDCSRLYMDMQEKLLRLDLDDPAFEIRTPLVAMSKKETMALADDLGILDFLLQETISCYEGIPREGCRKCPACLLRNEGLALYIESQGNKAQKP